MDVIYENIEEYNPNKERKILIALDDMIADRLSTKKLNPIVTKLFYCTKIHLNFIVKTPNKQELQQITFNHSSDIDFKYFMNFHKHCTAKPYSCLVIDVTLASDNLLRFRDDLLEKI